MVGVVIHSQRMHNSGCRFALLARHLLWRMVGLYLTETAFAAQATESGAIVDCCNDDAEEFAEFHQFEESVLTTHGTKLKDAIANDMSATVDFEATVGGARWTVQTLGDDEHFVAYESAEFHMFQLDVQMAWGYLALALTTFYTIIRLSVFEDHIHWHQLRISVLIIWKSKFI